ncbi:MAG: ABC transporter substrate-binding protein [Eubacteriales bacterium]
MKKKTFGIIIVLLIIVLVGAIWYLYGKDVKIFKSENGRTFEKSNIVRLPMLKVKTLNPINSKDKDSYYIGKLIFESLFYLDENMAAQPELVNTYSFDKDKKELHITIRNNAYFSNGEPLTAVDVKFSIDSLIASNKSIYAKYVDTIRSVSVDKGNEYSLTIKYFDLRNIALENLIFPIVSHKQFSEISKSGKKWESGIVPIGSGAYKISNYNDISELELVANEYYQMEKPSNTLNFTVLFSGDDIIPMLDAGTILMGISESMSVETLIADKNIKLDTFCAPDVDVLGFNFKSEITKNKNFRKAVAHLVNVDEINEDIYYGKGIKNDSIYFPNYLGVKNEGEKYKFSKQKSAKFLEKTKFKDLTGDGMLDISEKEPLKIKILVNNMRSEKVLTAEKLADSLKTSGINSELIFAKDDEEFNQKLANGDYDIFVATIHMNETYDLRSLLHSDYGNVTGYANPKLDELLDELKSGLTAQQAAKTYTKIKKILNDDLPYYCILYRTYSAMLSDNIKGVENLYFTDYYKQAPKWYCEYEVK